MNLEVTTVARYRAGPERYFLLNDNWADLADNRSPGEFAHAQLMGRTWIICWPPQSAAAIAHAQPTSNEA
ncbi:MAG: hypothetical protein KatS3mg052_1978 [Candidatus Roseilinea sp.]|nr:MAG: hypothetical protein KatS3mg052_1978 [Candidatus Roseilinea sp.]